MKLSEGEYDAVISLGGYCMPAQMLKLAGLRRKSDIFDWLFIDQNQLCEIIKCRFECFALKQNLLLLPSGDVIDTHSKVIFMHHFQGHRVGAAFLDDYEFYNTVLLRRAQAFTETLDSSARVLFIRLAHHLHSPDDGGEIEKCILDAAPNLDCHFLFINNQSEQYSSSRSLSVGHPVWPEEWWLRSNDVYNTYWQELLSRIRITMRGQQNAAGPVAT